MYSNSIDSFTCDSLSRSMAEEKHQQIPRRYDLSAKWDACVDLTIRRLAYASLTGAFSGLLLFRSPTTRLASLAFGAGVGVGSAYIECSHIFSGAPKVPIPQVPAAPSADEE
ncbi:hypothetical protein AXF42_Ash007753 [Apostasia shenzhenica]|uniref:MICOS complex subunit Mic10 n=1 Tax=Apostasia shenzhenica TaxID=1088818 RepID=A0A2I0B587_9ASPA|nr:hypothetical protein AXF42_Ash007753 [Apostasia shenzhenica]